MLSLHYIQKGLLFSRPSAIPVLSLPRLLRNALSSTLSPAASSLPPLPALFSSRPTTLGSPSSMRPSPLNSLFSSGVVSKDIKWCAEQLNRRVMAHNSKAVRKGMEDWERNPTLFPLGNGGGGTITMGSSPRFPMYDNDFGWGRSVAIRSGRANKYDGKISAFPGREGGGSVDLEVVLKPETLVAVESDEEFMQYVTMQGS